MSVRTADPIIQHLQTLAQEHPDLREAAEVYAALLPILSAIDLQVAPVAITPDEARAKMESGVPLLQGVDLAFNDGAAGDLLARLAQALENVSEENEEKPRRMASARQIVLLLEAGKLKAGALWRWVKAGDQAEVIAVAEAWQLDADLLWLLAQYSLTPALRKWARQLTPLVGRVEWPQSECFVCGAEVLFGELQGNGAEKHLRCGQCGADWGRRRMQCVFCGNEDHQTLSHLYFEAQRGARRVEVCDECQGYLKVITTFAPTPPELLLVQDLATVHLDYVAREHGYIRGGLRNKPSPATMSTSVRSSAESTTSPL